MLRAATIVALATVLIGAVRPASALERRVALLVASPLGGPGLPPLRYTTNDLDRVRNVLELLGGFADRDVLVSEGRTADDVINQFAAVRRRIVAAGSEPTLFVFYYSGHAKDGALRLGDSELELTRLKDLIEDTGATVRIALLDSCRSGSITRIKGASKGPPLQLSVEDAAMQAGQVLITASSAQEDAQESDAIQGSFFTHYLTTGLRGAADQDGDGNVTLSEAYAFAYGQTVATTIGTRGGVQHPTYRFDLRGAGDVVLTHSGRSPSAILFPADVSGHFIIFDMQRRLVVAELEKAAGKPTLEAVSPGDYVVKERGTDHLLMKRFQLRRGETFHVDPSTMQRVAFADDYAKGAVITAAQVLGTRVGVRLSAVAEGQVFLSGPVSQSYVPPLGLVDVRLDLDNLVRHAIGLRIDVGLGGSGAQSLQLNDAYLGSQTFKVTVSEVTAGASLTGSWAVTRWLDLEPSLRLGWVLITRHFAHASIPSQTFSTMVPGLGLDASLHLTSWLRLGLVGRVHYMYFSGDQSVSLGLFDGGLLLSTVLR